MNIDKMPKTIFAIKIENEQIVGKFFVPYLLKQNENVYVRYKKMTNDFLKKSDITLEDWQLLLVKLSNDLRLTELNKKFNKKYKRVSFDDFFKKTDKNNQKFIKEKIDKKKHQILEIIKQNKPILFSVKDRNSPIYPKDIIKIADDKAKVSFYFKKENEQMFYELKVFINEEQLDLQDEDFFVLTNKNPVIVSKNRLIWFENEFFNGNKLLPFKTKKRITYEERHKSFLFEKFIKPAVDKFDCKIEGFDFIQKNVTPKAYLYIEETIFKEFVFTVHFSYNDNKISFYSKRNGFVQVIKKNNEYALERIERNTEIEKKYIEFLQKQGLIQQEKFFISSVKSKDKYDFIQKHSKIILSAKKQGFIIVNNLFQQEVFLHQPTIHYNNNSKNNDWFDLEVVVNFGEFLIEFKDLKNHILNGIREFELPDKTTAIIPDEWFANLSAFAKRTNKYNRTIIQKNEFSLLEKNEILPPDLSIEKQIENFKIDKSLALPQNTIAKLRGYQKYGYKFLYSLTQNDFGVCLADDMGLGKTLQVITLLQKHFEENKLQKQPIKKVNTQPKQLSLFDFTDDNGDTTQDLPTLSALIVVPKSLIYNWVAELQKFAPDLSFAVYHNMNRQENFQEYIHRKNIIITTYGIVRQDIDFLKTFEFSYLILDESHIIKNPKSKIYKAILDINATHKISITGTPFENKLTDLWAQMNFLNKGLLGDFSYFEKTFIKPIDNNPYSYEIEELKTIINPFVLRRLKKDVAKDLPEKIEQNVYCQMTPEQAKWYEEEKSKIRNEILQNKNTNTIDVLASLNKLRQIAIHPKLQEPKTEMESGKFESIVQYVQNLLEQGDKFLIFSSYVKHLDLLKNYFQEHNIKFSYLTGKSANRQQIVEGYEKNDDIKPFLISIKAGGVGINLTSANYVLIIDPWWNPFVEQQAIDRTHRIGQTKNVFVYRFITKDTIEDKIIKLQQNKRNMSDALLDDNFLSKMDKNTLTSLV